MSCFPYILDVILTGTSYIFLRVARTLVRKSLENTAHLLIIYTVWCCPLVIFFSKLIATVGRRPQFRPPIVLRTDLSLITTELWEISVFLDGALILHMIT